MSGPQTKEHNRKTEHSKTTIHSKSIFHSKSKSMVYSKSILHSKHHRKSKKSKDFGLGSIDTQLDLCLESEPSESNTYLPRTDTRMELFRVDANLDFIDFFKDDEHIGDINKLDIKPLNERIESQAKEGEDPILKDVDCGEPLRQQHFYIDFTPIPGIDDDEDLFQKNEDFWNFVNSDEEMQKILYNMEDKKPTPRLVLPSISSTKASTKLGSEDILAGVHWMYNDFTDFTATSKLPYNNYCGDDGEEYFSDDDVRKKRNIALVSDDASYMTGETLVVAGGANAHL